MPQKMAIAKDNKSHILIKGTFYDLFSSAQGPSLKAHPQDAGQYLTHGHACKGLLLNESACSCVTKPVLVNC